MIFIFIFISIFILNLLHRQSYPNISWFLIAFPLNDLLLPTNILSWSLAAKSTTFMLIFISFHFSLSFILSYSYSISLTKVLEFKVVSHLLNFLSFVNAFLFCFCFFLMLRLSFCLRHCIHQVSFLIFDF